ncbi:MAG: hypothetical protein IJV65_10570 [Kiritimatiellae bacterium]|nr:hypothetical protein [Kiritimatiellia bacterium]
MEATPVYRVFGVGGVGCRIADAVVERTGGRLAGVAADTDFAALDALAYCRRLAFGRKRFGGLGSAGDVSAARMSAEEERASFSRELEGTSVAVAVAGLGGGTGAGALPVLLKAAEERGVPVLVVVLSPFAMQGADRVRAASTALRSLGDLGTARVLLSCDDLVAGAPGASLQEALDRATEVVVAALSLLWKMSELRGYVNLGPADVVQILRAGRGAVDFGRAVASGPRRFSEATDALWNQPGLGLASKASGAKAALLCVLGGPDLRLQEVGDAVTAVSAMLPFGTPVRLSTVVDPAAAGRLELVVLLFRRWAEPGAEDGGGAAASAASARFADTAATIEDGEDLDQPTFIRRRLHVESD